MVNRGQFILLTKFAWCRSEVLGDQDVGLCHGFNVKKTESIFLHIPDRR